MSGTPADGDREVTEATDAEPEQPAADERLDQPEDEATEHALRLMNEALRQGDAGRRWLVSENP
jgi:hypothetical protein